jgi:hypothetical protein
LYLIPEFESVAGVPEGPGLKVLFGQLQDEVTLQAVLGLWVADIGRTQTELKNQILIYWKKIIKETPG